MIKNKDLQIIIKAAHAGGKVLRKYFGRGLNVKEKSMMADYQTKADLDSEKAILKVLKKKFPKYNFLAEEGGMTENKSDYTFVIDPLDGTNNFVLGIPTFSVSIALLHKSVPLMAVVYQPIIDQTYCAIKGGGAYLNGKRIKVNMEFDPKKATVVYCCGYKTKINYFNRVMSALYETGCRRAINNWSVAFEHCMLASGKIESVINEGTEIYDFAAGKLIALEAGAKCITFSNKKEKDFTNPDFFLSNSDRVNKRFFEVVYPLRKFKNKGAPRN